MTVASAAGARPSPVRDQWWGCRRAMASASCRRATYSAVSSWRVRVTTHNVYVASFSWRAVSALPPDAKRRLSVSHRSTSSRRSEGCAMTMVLASGLARSDHPPSPIRSQPSAPAASQGCGHMHIGAADAAAGINDSYIRRVGAVMTLPVRRNPSRLPERRGSPASPRTRSRSSTTSSAAWGTSWSPPSAESPRALPSPRWPTSAKPTTPTRPKSTFPASSATTSPSR